MYEIRDGYVFQTFKDGEAIFYKESYLRHCGYHWAIREEQGREDIQNALLYPDLITSYVERNDRGKIIAYCKIYRKFLGKIKTSRGHEAEYWEVILKESKRQKIKIATAFTTSAMEYAIINNRIEKIEYTKKIK